MTHLPGAVLDHAARHHGVASHARLTELGLTRDRIIGLQQAGTLVPVLKGVYRIPMVPFDELPRCTAVCAAHDDAVISGPTAGRLWGFRRVPRDRRIHAIVRPRRQPTIERWVVPYRTAAIRDVDVVHRRDGIRVTSRARTALDLARFVDDTDLLSIIEQAARDGRLRDDDLRDVAVDFLSPRRPWLRRFLEQVDRRLDGGAAESHHETVMGDALRDAGLRGIVRQYEIMLPGYGPARFDIAIPELRWAIEVDVFPTHLETEGRRRDRRRDRAASAVAWDVTRLGEEHLGGARGATVRRLVAEYETRRRATHR